MIAYRTPFDVLTDAIAFPLRWRRVYYRDFTPSQIVQIAAKVASAFTSAVNAPPALRQKGGCLTSAVPAAAFAAAEIAEECS